MPTRTTRILTLRVHGPRPGRIGVSELNSITAAAQSAINRQAEAMEGRAHTLHPGPPIGKVQAECALELVSLTKGSTCLGFDFAKPQQMLPMIDASGLAAVNEVGHAIRSAGLGRFDDIDAGVLQSLRDLGSVLDGKIQSLEWIAPAATTPSKKRSRVNAKFGKATQARIAKHLQAPSSRPISKEGVLEMADFKADDFRCRLRLTLEPSVVCTFDASRSNEVQQALRHPVKIEGTATVNSVTGRIDSIRIERLTPLDSLELDAGSFFAHPTFDTLVRQQAIKPVKSVGDLAGALSDDFDVDEFVADIYRERA